MAGPRTKTAGPRTKRRAEARHGGVNANANTQRRGEGPKDDTAGSTPTRTAQRRGEGPKDDANNPTTRRRAEGRHGGVNPSANSPTTRRRAEPWYRGPNDRAEVPSDDTAGGQHQRGGPIHGTAGPTTARKAERGVGEPREGIRSRASLCSFFFHLKFLLTTRTAQQQHEGPRDDTVGVNTNAKGPTTTRTA